MAITVNDAAEDRIKDTLAGVTGLTILLAAGRAIHLFINDWLFTMLPIDWAVLVLTSALLGSMLLYWRLKQQPAEFDERFPIDDRELSTLTANVQSLEKDKQTTVLVKLIYNEATHSEEADIFLDSRPDLLKLVKRYK